jgi:hypothetical protein
MSNYAPDGTVIPGQRVSNFRATDSSANTMSAAQYEQARLAEAQRIEDQRILAERRARFARSKAAKGKLLSAQQIADESAAIGDKLRAFPDDPNSIIDALNPAVLVGDLASGLGQVPLNIQEGNYGQAAMNVAAPLVTGALLGGRNAADLANNLVNPLAGVRLKAPVSISKKLNSIGKPTFDIQELRNAYHNSSRSLSSSEMEYLNEKGFGRMSEYLAPSNQLPEPPNSINGLPFFVKDSLIRRGLSREERRAALNSFVSNSEARKNAFKQPSDFINRSGLTKKEALEKVSPKDKEAVAKMSEEEFSKTVLKPTGELVQYKKSQDLDNITYSFDTYGYMLKDQTPISTEEYISRFNKDIGLLNDIINKRNKSGVKYEATELKPIGLYDGALSFNTPKQRVPINPSKEDLAELEFFNRNPLKALKDLAGVKKVGNSYVFPNGMTFNSEDELIKFGREKIQENLGTKEIGGYSNFYTKINPGEWRGTVEDIPSTEYLRAIPGLEMSVTSNTVFSDRIPRKGTGAYESINDYLKQINLGRVKAGFNSQTPFSKGAWENFIKSGRAVGFYDDPNTVYSAMRTVLPVTAAAAASQEFKYGGMIKRADGTYSRRGLWDNIRANRGSGKEPTKEMLEQEKKIKAEDGMIVPQQNFFEESINTLPSMSRTTGTPFKNPGTGSITPAQKQSDIGKPFEYKGCVGGMCAGLARDNKMALKDFRKLNNLYGDAWEIADNMYGQGVDLSNYSNLRVGDIINMSRETFKSDKARGIPSSNQHVGYVSKIENGIPYVKHYIPNTGVMKKMDGDKEVKVPYGEYFEEPINNISAKYKYTATGASRLDWTREIDKKPSEFKFDRGYMPNKIEKAFMDVHNQKPDIQEKLKLTSDEYEQLSRVAYGIMGAESNYGKSIKTAYRMLVPDKYQEKIKIARDFLTGEEHGYDENINTLSRGYASLKSSTLYNIQDNNVNELQDIQRKVGVKPDGLYGPATKKAIEQYNAKNPNNPIKYRSVEERVREGDFEGLDKSGNYLYYALNRLGVDDKDLDSPEASTKALIATLAWHKKNNPNATDDDLIKAYTGKKNITNYKTVYDKYARNIDKIYGNSATPDMLTSVWENILTDVSLAGNETRKNFKKVTSAIASAVRDVAPLPIPVTAILGDIYGAKGDFTEKSLTSYTEDKLKEIVARQVKQGKYTLDYNAYFPEMSREDRLAISGGGGGSSSGMSKVAKLFSPEGMLQNFLGQAVIKPLGNGEYEIRDTYDFNDAGESFGVMEDLKRRGPDPYSIFRSLGRNYGSKDGLGAKVRIRIKLDN